MNAPLLLAVLLAAGFTADQMVTIGKGYADRGEDEKAIAALAEALEGKPKDRALAEYLLGRAFSRKDRLPEAAEHLRRSIELDPSRAEAWMLLGMSLDLARDAAGAQEVWAEAIARFPARADLRHEHGMSLVASGKAAEAVAELGEARKLDAGREGLDGDLGYAMLLAGRCAEAVKVLTAARDADGKDAAAAMHLGDAWACQSAACSKAGKPAAGCIGFAREAVEAYEAAVALDARSVRAQFHLGLMRSKSGDRDGARKALEAARALDPDNAKVGAALHHLGK